MSHTSQRRGLDPSRPGEELIVLAMVPRHYRGKAGIGEAMAELAETLLEYGGDQWPKATTDRLAMLARVRATTTLAVVFTDLRKVESLLNHLKGDWLARNREEGYPISIMLTGLTGDVHECCLETGLEEHTYLHSLGAFGRVKSLPSEDELALITMCGHGLIAASRVRHLVKSVQDGELTPEEAAEDIALPCVCGLSNKERAQRIFRRLAE